MGECGNDFPTFLDSITSYNFLALKINVLLKRYILAKSRFPVKCFIYGPNIPHPTHQIKFHFGQMWVDLVLGVGRGKSDPMA